MNPIEDLWNELERRIEELLKEWNNIGTDVTVKLVDSVPNVCGSETETGRGIGAETDYGGARRGGG